MIYLPDAPEAEAVVDVDGSQVEDDDGDEEELSEEERATRSRQAGNAYRLLTHWSIPPGVQNGVLDSAALNDWYNAACSALTDANRLHNGLRHIGEVLVNVPVGDEEEWPPVVVRDLLERVENKRLEEGIFLGLVNRRGFTTRGPEDGGRQELVGAGRYRATADQFADRWPRTAAILRGVAKSLENDARRNEDEAEHRRQGLD